ncbi:MAG: anion permease, partial [Bacteroidales bacterium]|nr:anion permease [Bacteroidales bacterium]
MSNTKFSVKYCVLLPIVLIVTVLLWALPLTAFGIEGLTVVQQRMIAIFAFAALMWMFEIIPNWTTSLIVIVVMLLSVSTKGLAFFCQPEFGTLVDYKSIMASFADPVVMLFMGGFVLAIVASKYGMDAVMAKGLLGIFGKNPKMVLLGFLLVMAVFSMFMSNTATAAMMLAFLAPVLKALPENETGKVGLALSIPIAANLGGIGTPIGTPPNAIAVGALENAGYSISFVTWMSRMIPFVIIMIVLAWV